MSNQETLRSRLLDIDGRGYGAYKSIGGSYSFDRYTLFIDHVQSDPFAPPSRLRVRVDQRLASFPPELYATTPRRIALEDYLMRQFGRAISRHARGHRGTGKSGLIAIGHCGQEILERTGAVVNKKYVEIRFNVGLPARGRTITGWEAVRIFFEEIPAIVNESLFYKSLDAAALKQQVELVEDQEFLRARLDERGLVAFVANGAILPRESGVSDRPLTRGRVIPFQSPPELEVSFELPNRGTVTGMGVPRGVTLIVGGGYHGKSTLLRALERGVYNHIPGDGRELVITVDDAVKIRAEDGRSVEKVDISAFINNLPHGQDTRAFSTENASGSTSQAANIVEALEVGTRLLLLDEDTSATNFMIRDGRMQELVAKEFEPITPFIDRVRQLYEHLGVSTVLVVGGSGDYFAVADRVIMMQNYIPLDVTRRAREIALRHRDERRVEAVGTFNRITSRIPLPASFILEGRARVKARGIDEIVYGHMDIDLQDVEQLVDPAQLRAIAEIIKYAAKHYINGERTLREVVLAVLADIDREGLDVVSPFKGQHPGDYARPRVQEIAAAINRYRRLQVRQQL
ncbi:putative ABC-class ATPase [Desulfofundulus luciae]|uniref:ABC-class ATPase n=1 Tax=Desulfofundulus luciae TaxID=74702 RepID=A0ABU0AZ69_9FIRM|nr:ABC-ATPase domain-containing protein [Desulfofundulus luciae]MDQ0285769.1 putative ABC-class ATPase [Desulfofundulus luciae]